MRDPGLVDSHTLTLAIAQLRDELAQLRRGSLYWLSCAREEDADLLCRQVLAGMAPDARAALLVGGRAPQALLQGLDGLQGPAELASFSFAECRTRATLEHLPDELERVLRLRGRLLLLSLPAHGWDAFDEPRLLEWCARLRAWLSRHGCCLLVLSHGTSATLALRLHACNEYLAGLAQLYRGEGRIHYLVHFWRNALGVNGSCELELEEGAAGLAVCSQSVPAALPVAGDQQLNLALREVLEGAPALSEHWLLFDEPSALLARALRAQAASVLLEISSNARVGDLARQLAELRRRRGAALKLVVRELEPCLRAPDEQALLGCGANLIVPYGTRLPRFLNLLGSVQGQLWRGRLPADIDAFLRHRQPPPLCGVLPVGQFVAKVRELLGTARPDEVQHLLLELDTVPGLSVAQAFSQCRLQRNGDFACLLGGRLYLFLFGCPVEALEMALGNVFRLPWRELFVGHRVLAGVDELRPDWSAVALADDSTHAAPEPLPQPVSRGLAAPQRVALANALGAP